MHLELSSYLLMFHLRRQAEISLEVICPREPAVTDEQSSRRGQRMLVRYLLLEQAIYEFPVLFVERMAESRL